MPLGIDGHDGPDVRRTAAIGSDCGIRGSARFIRSDRIPAPAQRAGARVIRTEDAARHVDALIVVNGGTYDDEVIDDRRRRGHVIPTGAISWYVAQINLARFAEVCARRSVRRIDRYQ